MHLTYLDPGVELETAATTWNPISGQFRDVSPGFGNMFCSGQNFLPSGELLVAGGYLGVEADRCLGRGVRPAYIFDPFSSSWTSLGNMSAPRFYPTVLALGQGRQLIIGGQGENCQYIPWMEMYNPAKGLSRVRGPNRIMQDYPRTFLLSNGELIHVGIEPVTSYLDSKQKSWTSVTVTGLGRIRYELAAFYVPGHQDRIMICGGYLTRLPDGTQDEPTTSCEAIDALAPNPTWRPMAPMHHPRGDVNAVILPDGKVMVVGGGEHSRYEMPELNPELYDPATNSWTLLPAQHYGRMYHSTAVLLPDGRVLSAGQDDDGSGDGVVSGNWGEIYSPSYLFRGARPKIKKAPVQASYGSTFDLKVTKGTKIRKVVLIGLSAVTHSTNVGQRYVPLEFAHSGRKILRAMVEPNPNLAPPGYYMLFVVTDKGVPSVARIVQLTAD